LVLSPRWFPWFGIPTRVALVPNTGAATAFASAFAFGWALRLRTAMMQRWATNWPLHLVTVVATAACLSIAGLSPSIETWPTRRKKFPRDFVCDRSVELVGRIDQDRVTLRLPPQCISPVSGRCLILDLPRLPSDCYIPTSCCSRTAWTRLNQVHRCFDDYTGYVAGYLSVRSTRNMAWSSSWRKAASRRHKPCH
jgi:hypothetical protein